MTYKNYMSQIRNKTGTEFEKKICENQGWIRKPKSPKIIWSGKGKTNLEKILSINFNPDKFYPLPQSDFTKYDAQNTKGEFIEIKKYNSSRIKGWYLYSEPAFKISTKRDIPNVVKLFGNGSLDLAKQKYNNFVELMYNKIGDKYLNEFVKLNSGIQFEDKFIPKSNIDYRWYVYKNSWMGFDRLSIQFKITGTD